jgi:hypothetical protein
MDRVIHRAQRFELEGESMRKLQLTWRLISDQLKL